MDETRVVLAAEKVTKVLNIRAETIKRTNDAMELVRSGRLRFQVNGMFELENTLNYEKRILPYIIEGAKEGIQLIDDFIGGDEFKCAGEISRNVTFSVRDVMRIFTKKTLKIMKKRMSYEESYLHEQNALRRAYYWTMFKKCWTNELVIDSEIYKRIHETEVQSAVSFWEEAYNACASLPETIKRFPEKLKSVPRDILKREVIVAIRDHNIFPIIVANPTAAAFIAFSPEMDDLEKAALAYAVWATSGFITRVAHILLSFKKICALAEITYRAEVARKEKPANVFIGLFN